MSPSVRVYSTKKVVLIFSRLNHCIKIAALKIAIKQEFAFDFKSRVHTSEDAGRGLTFEMTVEFAEIGCHVRVVCAGRGIVLKRVLSLHLLVKLETATVPIPCLSSSLPR